MLYGLTIVQNVATYNPYCTAIGREEPRQRADGCAFPGPVWSEQAKHLSFLDGKANSVDGAGQAVVFYQILDLQDGLRHNILLVRDGSIIVLHNPASIRYATFSLYA